MLSEILLTQTNSASAPPHKFCVYFDEWTGIISAITNKPNSSIREQYLLTDDPICQKLMLGVVSTKKYIVAELLHGFKLIQKDNFIRLRRAEQQLSKLSEIKLSTQSDINVVLYLSDYKMEVNIRSELIHKLSGKQKSQIKINQNEYDDISFFLTLKNNPIVLYENITVKILDLLQNGYQMIDLSHLKNKVELRNIDVLTKRIFKTYGIKYKNQYLNPDYNVSINNKRRHISILDKSVVDKVPFTVSPSTQGWIIRSNFEHAHEYKIYKDIKMFLTTDNPNAMLDRIVIPFDKIGNYQEYIIKTTVDPTTCKILVGEEGRNIDFKFEDIEYDKSS
jgi:hypothetical protein